MFVPPDGRQRPSNSTITFVRHLSLIFYSFTKVFVEDANHIVEGIVPQKDLLPGGEVPVYKVQCFEVPHARRNLCSHVQEAVKAERRKKNFILI